jgi:opacity protein-like surface antigen
MKKVFIATAATLAFTSAAQAAEGPYIGVGVANNKSNIATPAGASNIQQAGNKASGKIFGGVELNNTFGVEAGYTDFRKADHSYTTGTTVNRVTTDGHATYLAGKANAPVSDKVNMYGKLGVVNKRLKQTGALSRSESENQLYAGVGAEYKLNQQVALALEYERYGKKTAVGPKPDVWTVAAKYSF